MADDAEDVLELDSNLELDDEPEDEAEDQQTDGDLADDEASEEDVIGFGEEGAAPAPENETSVIRDLRKANRELAKKVAKFERGSQPQAIDPGPKPTLADCDFDEERFETELETWKANSAKAENAQKDAEEQAKAQRDQWLQRVETYKSGKTELKVRDFDAAEEEVFAVLSEQHQALLMLADKSAALVYALSKAPAKLAELSKLDLTRAAMMVGKLEDKLTVSTRKPPAPDTALRGNAALSAGRPDKKLAELEKEADRTGDRTKLIAYRKTLKPQAKN